MMKKWKKLMVSVCTASMLVTMPVMGVLAGEMSEEDFILVEAEEPEETVKSVDSPNEEIMGVEKFPSEEPVDFQDEIIGDDVADQDVPEEVVGESEIRVGDGVTGTFDSKTGTVKFVSQDGVLWSDWVEKLGISRGAIKAIEVESGTVYLPIDSSGYNRQDKTFRMFGGLSVLKSLDMSNFNTSNVKNMSYMFFRCYSLINLELNSIDTMNVTDMSYMFAECENLENLHLDEFVTSNVIDMSYMFGNCDKLYTLTQQFDTSNVTNMRYMFGGCEELEYFYLGDFDTSNVTDMSYMFYYGPDLSDSGLENLDTAKVTNMSNMFSWNIHTQDLDLSSFNTSSVTDMSDMFFWCAMTYIDVSSFDTSNVKDMSGMFGKPLYSSFIGDLDVSKFDTSKVTNMSGMFEGFYDLTSLDVSNFNTSNVTDMSSMFADCSDLINLDLSNFDTSNVTNMSKMFESCEGLAYLDISSFNTSKVTDMSNMFSHCGRLMSLDLRNFNTSKVTNMDSMFEYCTSLTVLDLKSFNTMNVRNMGSMFWQCHNLTHLYLSSFNTSNVFSMYSMFSDCSSLTDLDLSNFDCLHCSDISMLDGCDELQILKTPKNIGYSYLELPVTMYAKSGKAFEIISGFSRSITLTREKPLNPGFSDVQNPDHAYFEAIYWAAEKGITKGYSDGTFGINRSCTRGEMMMFLWRYAGKQEPKTVSKTPFKDVPKTHTFYKAILWGSQKGITKGYSDGTFGVNRNVSRGECMMFLWRLKGKPAPKAVAKAPFPDVPKSHVFYNAVLWGYQKKITTGFTSGKLKGKFGVNENCSRGQIVTFLYRAK